MPWTSFQASQRCCAALYALALCPDGRFVTAGYTGSGSFLAAQFHPGNVAGVVPRAPTGLSASAVGESAVNLSWSDPSGMETGFAIEISLDGTAFVELATVAADTLGYPFTEAYPNLTQYFRVRAFNDFGSSAFPNVASALTIPRAPEDLMLDQVTASQIDLSWPVPTGLTGYTLEWRQDGGGWTPISLSGSTGAYSHTGLTEGRLYEYQLKASNGAGASAASAIVGATTLPAAPSGLTATPSDGAVSLQWSHSFPGETGFEVEALPSGGEWRPLATVSPDVTTYAATDLLPQLSYSFRVRAVNDSGESAYSNTASATPTGGEVIGSWNIAAAPVSATMVSGSGDDFWMNVVNQVPTLSEAFVGFSILDAALGIGAEDFMVVELAFADGAAVNQPGTDLVLFNPKWGDHAYEVSTSHDNFAGWYAPALSATGVFRDYYTNLGYEPGIAIEAGPIDLTALGVPEGVSVSSIRVRGTSRHAELLGVGALPKPKLGVWTPRPQAAEGSSDPDATAAFVVYRDAHDRTRDLDVTLDLSGAADRSADYTVSFTNPTGSSFDPATGRGTARIPANQSVATITITAGADGSGAPDQPTEDVALTLVDKPHYTRAGGAAAATVNILDTKKLFVYFYGFQGPGKFADEWLDKIGEAMRGAGYELFGDARGGRGGFNEYSSNALLMTLDRINRNNDRRISVAEAEAVDLRMLGWSFGGTQAVNFSHILNRQGKWAGRHMKLERAVPIEKLITWDPVKALYLGPVPIFPFKPRWGRVNDNVTTFRNDWQWNPKTTVFKRFENGALVGRAKLGDFGTLFFHGEDVETTLPAGDRVKQYRVDRDRELWKTPEYRDRINAYDAAREAAGDSDPFSNPGDPVWRLYGSQVNHQSIAWYAYGSTFYELRRQS